MSTAAQIEANRENAQSSTGPKTPEGKSASSQNSLRWGFFSEFRVLAWENQVEFTVLFESLRDEYEPKGATEKILVDRMAQHLWLSQRAQRLQDHHIEDEKRFGLFLRYQTTNDRAFHKCLNDLLKLRAEKRKQGIGFASQKQAEAETARKAELTEARTRMANAKAAHQELDTDIKGSIHAQIPGFTDIPFNALKNVLATALEEVATSPALYQAMKKIA